MNVAQLLLEFFSEEIPARMQARAEADLERLLSAALKEAGLGWERFETFSGPRRLGCVIEGLPLQTEAVREERKGPRTDAPEKALEGFMRGAGVSSLDQCEVREDKKGSFYVALIETPGRKTADVIAAAIPQIARDFPWPKSMKFGEGEKTQRWVRPLQRVLCLLEGEVVPFEVFGIATGNETEGHRRMGPGPFAVKDFADYETTLRDKGHVVLKRADRMAMIAEQAAKVCADAGLKLVEDEGLLNEVAGLAEWPIAILGQMDPDFLDLPPEVIQLTMKTHQKYFAVARPDGSLSANFVVVANQDAPDGGKAIAAGNARVLSARLSDARHFWDKDIARGLEDMAKDLSKVTFHEKLGSMRQKVWRICRTSLNYSVWLGADAELTFAAAELCKADLVSQMVYEFPELQGVMGRYYAEFEGRHKEVVKSIEEHYFPVGKGGDIPRTSTGSAISIIDKLDNLIGFWTINERPTGSKDPFGLRRDAIGVIRILLDRRIKASLQNLILAGLIEHLPLEGGMTAHDDIAELEFPAIDERFFSDSYWRGPYRKLRNFIDYDDLYTKFGHLMLEVLAEFSNRPRYLGGITKEEFFNAARKKFRSSENDSRAEKSYSQAFKVLRRISEAALVEGEMPRRGGRNRWDYYDQIAAECPELDKFKNYILTDLLAFFAERLKVHLKDEGVRFDVIDAVFALGDDDLVRVTNRARALQAFLDSEDGAALLAGYRRAANILKAEEKKDADAFTADLGDGALEAEYLNGDLQAEEAALIAALESASKDLNAAVGTEDFEGAMRSLAVLRGPVDAFFDKVTVNADNAMLRRNRLRLLARIRSDAHVVADLSKIEG